MQFLDSFQHTVFVGSNSSLNATENLSFWPMDSVQAQWLPNESLPERASVVVASRDLVQDGKVFVVSVPELARAGLDVSRLSSIHVVVTKAGANQVKITPIY